MSILEINLGDHFIQDYGMFKEIDNYCQLPCSHDNDQDDALSIGYEDPLESPMYNEVLQIFRRHEKNIINIDNTIHLDKIGQDSRTRLMIKNIPIEYTEVQLIQEVQHAGFSAAYTFLYMPQAKTTNKRVKYAFINLKSLELVRAFYQTFSNRRWSSAKKAKPCILCYAKHT